MEQMKEVRLPSGAILKISVAPFAEAKALYQAILKELRTVQVNSKLDMAALYKDLACAGFSSSEIEAAIWRCLGRCTYNDGKGDFKITEATFEPVKNRDDYLKVQVEVVKENVLPFVKSLSVEYAHIFQVLTEDPTLRPRTASS